MANEIIHDIVFLKINTKVFLPVVLVSQDGQNKQWIIPNLLNSAKISYNSSQFHKAISLYSKHSENVNYLYRGKWIDGGKFANLIKKAQRKALFVEELKPSDFPTCTLIYGSGKDMVNETWRISDSRSLLRFIGKYHEIIEDKNYKKNKVIPILEFPKDYLVFPGKRERKVNYNRNKLEEEMVGKYVLYAKNGSSINGYVKSVDKKRVGITTDIFEAKYFETRAIAFDWARSNELWDVFGIKTKPVMIDENDRYNPRKLRST